MNTFFISILLLFSCLAGGAQEELKFCDCNIPVPKYCPDDGYDPVICPNGEEYGNCCDACVFEDQAQDCKQVFSPCEQASLTPPPGYAYFPPPPQAEKDCDNIDG